MRNKYSHKESAVQQSINHDITIYCRSSIAMISIDFDQINLDPNETSDHCE